MPLRDDGGARRGRRIPTATPPPPPPAGSEQPRGSSNTPLSRGGECDGHGKDIEENVAAAGRFPSSGRHCWAVSERGDEVVAEGLSLTTTVKLSLCSNPFF